MFLGIFAASPSDSRSNNSVAMVQWVLSRTFSLLGLAVVVHLIVISSFAEKGPSIAHVPRRHERSYEGHRGDRGPGVGAKGTSQGNALVSTREKPEHIFVTANSTVVTAQIGSTAALPCALKGSGSGVVSWIRHQNYHLLTVGLGTYSGDDRFFVAHTRHTQNWALQIRYVQPRDAGLFECQVSTHPPTSIFIQLRVVEARADILGAPDKHVKSGSTLRLLCALRESTEAPVYVFWYHNDRMINYDKTRGVTVNSDRYSSVLTVSEAEKTDSGNYTCVPSNAKPASINVHILNGEKPAAMQHGSRSSADRSSAPSCPVAVLMGVLVLLAWSSGRGCGNVDHLKSARMVSR